MGRSTRAPLSSLRMLFIRDGQIVEELSGSIQENWNRISDFLDNGFALAIQRSDGRPISREQAWKLLSLLVEDIAEDMWVPVISRTNKGAFFAAIDPEAEPFSDATYRQYRQFLSKDRLKKIWGSKDATRMEKSLGDKTFEVPEHWSKYTFQGAVEMLEKLTIRPPLEDRLAWIESVDPRTLSPSLAWLREKLLIIKPALLSDPFVRDEDLWDFANELCEEFEEDYLDVTELNQEEFEDLIKEEGIESSWIPRGQSNPNIQKLAEALKQTTESTNGLIEYQKRVIIKLADHHGIPKSAALDMMGAQLLDDLEVNALGNFGDCIWCGRTDLMSKHSCEIRKKLLALV